MINIIKLFTKQYFYKNKYSLIIFVFIALFSLFFFSPKAEKDLNNIKIGFCIEDNEEISNNLLSYEGIFKFYKYNNETDLKNNVLNGNIDCGYIFKKDFLKNILDGKGKNQILLLKSEGSKSYKLSYEIVFSEVLYSITDDFFLKYIEDSPFLARYNKNDLHKKLKDYFEKSFENDTFKFEYEVLGEKVEQINTSVSPVREFIAVYIFILAMFCLSAIYENKNTLKNAHFKEKFIFSQISIFITVLMSVILGFILIYTFKINNNIFKELYSIAWYFVCLLIFIEILYFILPNNYILYCTVPTIIILTLIICPIFIDLATYLPPIKYLQKLFPAYHYLNLIK